MDLGRTFTEVLMVDLDLGLSFAPFGDLSLVGRAGLGATVTLDAILSVGIDLDDDGGGDVFGEVFLFTDPLDTNIAVTVDAIGTDINFTASLGPLGVAIIGGDGRFLLDVGFDVPGAVPDSRVSIKDPAAIAAAFGAFVPTAGGTIDLTLPVFFPTPSDFVGDISFSADLTTADGSTLDFVAPPVLNLPLDLLDASFYTSFGILSSLPLVIEAVDLLLETVQDKIGRASCRDRV